MSILTAPGAALPDWAADCINLADPRLGARGVTCTDDFFAPLERMLNPAPATFVPGKYDENGKWMDGWESRRRRGPGNDWSIVRLGAPGTLAGVDVDTSFFTGNYPPAFGLEACLSDAEIPADTAEWTTLFAPTPLKGNSHQFFAVPAGVTGVFSHVRLSLFPDGGVARLRVYGRPVPEWADAAPGALCDLVSVRNGGQALAWNDAHFGVAANLLLPGRGADMGDGWETRRRREPGHDWCLLALGAPGEIRRVEVDTAHFKGNFPDRCSLHAAYAPGLSGPALIAASQFWPVLLPEVKLTADAIHMFEAEVQAIGRVTHVRLNIHPDGGISRLRLFGSRA